MIEFRQIAKDAYWCDQQKAFVRKIRNYDEEHIVDFESNNELVPRNRPKSLW